MIVKLKFLSDKPYSVFYDFGREYGKNVFASDIQYGSPFVIEWSTDNLAALNKEIENFGRLSFDGEDSDIYYYDDKKGYLLNFSGYNELEKYCCHNFMNMCINAKKGLEML